jgi:hypothetical protein
VSKKEDRPSLFAQHGAILGHTQSPLDEAARKEKERIASLPLEPLSLPSHRPVPRFRRSLAFASVALAVLVSVVVARWPFESEESGDLRIKGESEVWFYWERDGLVQDFVPGTVLQNGDRIRAEVLAAKETTAYLAVMAQDGRLLGDVSKVKDSMMMLKAGEKASFAGSVKLVGANDGESLVVILCAQGVRPDFAEPFQLASIPQACTTTSVRLR